jgi:hypothetical protein
MKMGQQLDKTWNWIYYRKISKRLRGIGTGKSFWIGIHVKARTDKLNFTDYKACAHERKQLPKW